VWRYHGSKHDPLDNNANLSYTAWQLFAGVRYQLKPKIWSTLKLGRSFERKLNYDEGTATDLRLDDGNVLMFTLGFHP